jgi:hypothetical protein
MPPAAPITVFTGRFGSGKTEVSLNYASYLVEQARRARRPIAPTLIDLDLVTPYFRTRDRAEEMSQRGVKVIAPFSVGRHISVPAVSPQILGAIEQRLHRYDPSAPVVIDLGGDRQGARALASYAAAIERGASARDAGAGSPSTYAMYFVLNPYRPDPASGLPLDTVERICAAILEIEASARLKVTALISNPHMLDESTPELYIAGHRAVQRASESLRLPIAFGVVSESLFGQPCCNQRLAGELPLLVIHRFFKASHGHTM